jgi:hypothetical protein
MRHCMSASNKPLTMPSPSTNARTCPYCGTHYEPMAGNRGYEQIYCSPKCRRAEHRRREAMRHRGEPITAPASRPSVAPASRPSVAPTPRPSVAPAPRTAPVPSPVGSLEPQDGPTPEWVYDMLDDLCAANWNTLRWLRRYEHAVQVHDRDMKHIMAVIERIERRMNDI